MTDAKTLEEAKAEFARILETHRAVQARLRDYVHVSNRQWFAVFCAELEKVRQEAGRAA